MCEGWGVRVFERVMLPSERFNEFNQPKISSRSMAPQSDEYFYDLEVTYLRRGSPDLLRMYFKIVRRSDGRVLGEAISYGRRGGDLPGPGHPTYFKCPDKADITDLALAVIQGAKE